jgi:Tol biopolymer transport system component
MKIDGKVVITILVIVIIVLILFTTRTEKPADEEMPNLIYPGEMHFKNLRQLTFSGENAEAYFSADGKRLIFQAHDGPGLCDQIYILDLETMETRMVSTGDGVTTCSYFQYPDDQKIIYASTHLAAKECPPPPDYSRGYIWKLHPGYDIFQANPDGSQLVRLTDAPGYDAEGTYAEDGSRIVYTSMASGDLEIWTMKPDGSDKQMLTDRLGYDGGAFYSHDGSKIVWRAYYPETPEEIADYKALLADNSIRPMALQIRVMNADGSGKIQVTHNEAANFGPYFFPDDKRIIFSSNMDDPRGRNFELYAVNVDGSGLERITQYEGFDGFPMFSPDGRYFVFASNRNAAKEGDTNIFICEWVD